MNCFPQRCVCRATRLSRTARRTAETAAETAIEIGDIVEAADHGDLADAHAVTSSILQHPVAFLQAQLEHPLGKADAGFLQEIMNIARRQFELSCDAMC